MRVEIPFISSVSLSRDYTGGTYNLNGQLEPEVKCVFLKEREREIDRIDARSRASNTCPSNVTFLLEQPRA